MSLSPIRLFATPWTVAYHTPPSMGFSRKEFGVGCHCLLQRIYEHWTNQFIAQLFSSSQPHLSWESRQCEGAEIPLSVDRGRQAARAAAGGAGGEPCLKEAAGALEGRQPTERIYGEPLCVRVSSVVSNSVPPCGP